MSQLSTSQGFFSLVKYAYLKGFLGTQHEYTSLFCVAYSGLLVLP